jgi:hypothetical protein
VPATLVAAVVYLGLHLPFLAWAPDDIDSTNFMLALRDFDLRAHQPHPPGYPVFIAMGHAARAMISMSGPLTGPSSPDTLDVNALALVSAVFGALAVFPLVALWAILGGDRSRAWLAAVLAMCSPLFWYTGIRPLSDLPGLAVAAMSLAFLVRDILAGRASGGGWGMFAGSILAGLAAGVRMQTLWLTSPALGAAVAVMLWRRNFHAVGVVAAGFAIGVLAWAIPFVIAVGGWRSYIDVLTAQAADDFRGAILAVDFSPRVLAFALYDSFVLPWGSVGMAVIVLAFAMVGLVRIARTEMRQGLVLAFVFVPYAMLHLLFHETSHTRYALPLVLPVAYLAVSGLHRITRTRWAAALALIVVAAWTSMVPVVAQARVGPPAVRALSDVQNALHGAGETHPVIAMHHAVRQHLRFADLHDALLPGPLRYEWLAVVDHFRSGGEAPVWFLASRRRSDLVLFDPAAKRAVNEYLWTFAPEAVLGGARPRAVTWYEIRRPGWMAGEGWALTPETRGVAERSHRSPGAGASVAYIARRADKAVMMIGGRNLGGPCHTAARLEAWLEGRKLAEWQLPAGEPFLQFLDLPAGTLGGARGFAELRLVASDLSGAGLGVDVSLEQFDVQSGHRPVAGLALGWHEPELEPATGQRWRWAAQRAVLQIRNFGRDVVLGLHADDPTHTVGRAVELQVRSAGHVLARRRFDKAVNWSVSIPKEIIEQAGGRVTIMSDASFVPDLTDGNGDRRELALRVFDVAVEFDRPGGS